MARSSIGGDETNAQFKAINDRFTETFNMIKSIESQLNNRLSELATSNADKQSQINNLKQTIDELKPNRDKIIEVMTNVNSLETKIEKLNDSEAIIDVEDFDYIG